MDFSIAVLEFLIAWQLASPRIGDPRQSKEEDQNPSMIWFQKFHAIIYVFFLVHIGKEREIRLHILKGGTSKNLWMYFKTIIQSKCPSIGESIKIICIIYNEILLSNKNK